MLITRFFLVAVILLQQAYSFAQHDTSWNKFQVIRQPQKEFIVYKIRSHIYAIRAFADFEDVNCYLIEGKDAALLFDTGLGLGNMQQLVSALTPLPVIVLNSHSHYDHIGGNYLFHNIISLNNSYSKANARGMSHADFIPFYKQAYSVSNDTQLRVIPSSYFIHPFFVTRFVNDNDSINLGGHVLEIIKTPGHTPDEICLLDRKDSLLFSGDMLYKGTLFLHLKESNFEEYAQSVQNLRGLAPSIAFIMPAHGATELQYTCLDELSENIAEINSGKAVFKTVNGVLFYKFPFFKFLVKDVPK